MFFFKGNLPEPPHTEGLPWSLLGAIGAGLLSWTSQSVKRLALVPLFFVMYRVEPVCT